MTKATILIIDDEPQLRKLLTIVLETQEYKVITADTAKLGIAMAATHKPDLILLDIELPDRNGIAVLQDLREWYQQAVIMLSVVNTEDTIVKALDNGATDYVLKPFRNAELLARIRSGLKKNLPTTTSTIFTCGDLTIDTEAHIVKKDDMIIKLTQTEYQLLQLLAIHEGRVLTQQFILKAIWGVGSQTETQYLRVFIATLRKKIETNPAKPEHIITENGIGYRFQ